MNRADEHWTGPISGTLLILLERLLGPVVRDQSPVSDDAKIAAIAMDPRFARRRG